jgi:hypothetical protein
MHNYARPLHPPKELLGLWHGQALQYLRPYNALWCNWVLRKATYLLSLLPSYPPLCPQFQSIKQPTPVWARNLVPSYKTVPKTGTKWTRSASRATASYWRPTLPSLQSHILSKALVEQEIFGDPWDSETPKPRDTHKTQQAHCANQDNSQTLFNFYPRIWRPKLPRRSFTRTGRPWMTARDDVRNTRISILYDNVSYVRGRLRANCRARYLCNAQFCTFTSLHKDQVTSCFLSAVNTTPSPAPLILSGFYYRHHLPSNHGATDLQFASHSGKTLTPQEFYISCLKKMTPWKA